MNEINVADILHLTDYTAYEGLFIAFVVCAILTALLLPYLRRLHAGQSIREDGPEAHKAKAGTPTMGGIAIIVTVALAGIFNGDRAKLVESAVRKDLLPTLVVVGATVAFGLIGFFDDFLKVRRKQNEGLKAWQKFGLQIVIAVALALVSVNVLHVGTSIRVPFTDVRWDLGHWFVPFAAFVGVAMSNAVNLTDGLDGLASSVTAIVALTLSVIFSKIGDPEMSVMASTLCGAVCGFLLFNHHPAKVFMGDTGSLAIGGALTAMCMVSGTELFLPIAGFIYVAEVLSDILQVAYFKATHGKRIFKMAPLHHHFELCGWKETKVVAVFAVATALVCILAYLGA